MDWDDLLGDFQGRTPSPRKSINWSWLGSLFSGASGVLGTILQNVFNTRQIKETNKANENLVRMQNEAAKEESELAYKRSLPQNQVANLMNAGMSRAGAINTLTGGGSYQPAPVAVSENDAPQIDVSQAINAIQASAQLQEQKRQFNMQHAEQKRQFNAEHSLKQEEFNKHKELINEQIHDVIASYTGKGFDNAIKNIEYRIAKANEERRINAEDSKYLAEQATAALEALKAVKQKEAWNKMSTKQIAEYYELQAKLEILSNLGNTKATDLLAKIISIF